VNIWWYYSANPQFQRRGLYQHARAFCSPVYFFISWNCVLFALRSRLV